MRRPTAGGLCAQVRAWPLHSVPWYDTAGGQTCYLPFLLQAEAQDTWQSCLVVGLRICTGPAFCLAKPGAFPPSSAQHSDGQDLQRVACLVLASCLVSIMSRSRLEVLF